MGHITQGYPWYYYHHWWARFFFKGSFSPPLNFVGGRGLGGLGREGEDFSNLKWFGLSYSYCSKSICANVLLLIIRCFNYWSDYLMIKNNIFVRVIWYFDGELTKFMMFEISAIVFNEVGFDEKFAHFTIIFLLWFFIPFGWCFPWTFINIRGNIFASHE